MIHKLWRDQTGATAIEYALIASMIALVIIGAIMVVGEGQGGLFDFIEEQVVPAFAGALGGG